MQQYSYKYTKFTNIMKCSRCNKQATVNFDHLPSLCSRCFIYIIEKRVRKQLRTTKPIKKASQVAVLDDNTKESMISLHLLKNLQSDLPFKITVLKRYPPTNKYSHLFIPWNANDEANLFLINIFEKKSIVVKGDKLLGSVSEKELNKLCEVLKIKKTKTKRKYDNVLDKFEEMHPEAVFSIIKSSSLLEKLSRQT